MREWLKVSPRNVVTVLDTHDGIGVIDVGPDATRTGLLNAAQIDEVVEGIHGASQGQSRQATGAAASNVDLYQVNCTYYSALGEDADRYLLTRLAQFLSPGIPQVYYAGLLAAPNAMELLELTGVGRDINRPYYSLDDIETQVQRPVVRRLLAMCRWRTRESVFRGAFEVLDSPAHELAVRWTSPDRRLEACLDFDAVSFSLTMDGTASATTWDDFASL